MTIPKYPKIFHVGGSNIRDLLKGTVEVTEKLDGSSFGFGKVNGELVMRSRNKTIHPENTTDGMFAIGVAKVLALRDKLPDNTLYYGEYLNKPRHNHIEYDRVPTGHIALFGMMVVEDVDTAGNPHGVWMPYSFLEQEAERLGLDLCKLIYKGEIKDKEHLKSFLGQVSQLGGKELAEGIVVKNYNHKGHYAGFELPFLCGKLVRADFKERQKVSFKTNHTVPGQWQAYCESFAVPARWRKAMQHLRDDGALTDTPKDIGPLLKEIQKDITEECKTEIMETMWRLFGKELLRKAIKGFPEWYKDQLTNELMETTSAK